MEPEQNKGNHQVKNISAALGGFKGVSLILLVIIVGMLLVWKPWQKKINAADRTISVDGETSISAVPDQFTFSPDYNFSDSNRQTALTQLQAKSTEIISKLKALGVTDKMIQTNSGGYSGGVYLPVVSDSGTTTYDLSFTITITDQKLAQKVQDYLLTTDPMGTFSPSADFTPGTQKKLEATARTQAEQDARSKADESAKNLGFKVEGVKTVTDGGLNNGNPRPILNEGVNTPLDQSAAPSLSVEPGQNQLTYTVTVVYYIH